MSIRPTAPAPFVPSCDFHQAGKTGTFANQTQGVLFKPRNWNLTGRIVQSGVTRGELRGFGSVSEPLLLLLFAPSA